MPLSSSLTADFATVQLRHLVLAAGVWFPLGWQVIHVLADLYDSQDTR
jgi:hypothetical protein